MKLTEILTEKRSNPDNNPKFSTIEQLAKYQGREQDLYISFTFEDKIGINPNYNKKNRTPAGIYTYQLDYALPEILKEKGLFALPYLGEIPPRYVWVITPKTNVMVLNDYNNFESDLDKLRHHFAGDERKLGTINWHLNDSQFGRLPESYKLWRLTEKLCRYNNTVDWNVLLRKVLGYPIIRDDGLGVIHYYEKTQTAFLSTSTFSVVEKIIMKRHKYRKPKKTAKI